jgi:hypothetical protein
MHAHHTDTVGRTLNRFPVSKFLKSNLLKSTRCELFLVLGLVNRGLAVMDGQRMADEHVIFSAEASRAS